MTFSHNRFSSCFILLVEVDLMTFLKLHIVHSVPILYYSYEEDFLSRALKMVLRFRAETWGFFLAFSQGS